MKSGNVEIVNKLGLHARAASKLVNVTKSYAARIELGRSGATPIDAKSIMAVMMLEAIEGTTLELRCEGDDEDEAFRAVSEIVANRFGEDE